MGRAGRPVRVLHVDDDERYASMVVDRLGQEGALSVATETSAADAVQRLRAESFDCLLADYKMPGVDGLELVRRVRERDPDLPIIVLTGQGSEAVASEAISAGVTDYFRKDEQGRGFDLLANRIETAAETYRTERRLREERHRNDEFVRLVAHDLRNPMAVARGWIDVLHDDGGEVPYRKAVDAIQRMDDIVDNLERLARSGETEATAEQVELSSVATAAWELVDSGGADLHVEFGPEVRADPSMLQQALENLFGNAVEHGPADDGTGEGTADEPAVTVRVGATEDGFFVEDDGTGIVPEERERIFESGYSVDGGTGLGLAIVDRIAEAHDWTIAVTESEDGGARFEFTDVAFVPPDDPLEPSDEAAETDGRDGPVR